MGCRKLSSCEINSVIANDSEATVFADSCCNRVSREMCASAVKINGDYRITCEGRVCNMMINALASGDSVTVKYSGKNCCGKYCVTASGVPDSVTLLTDNRVRFTLSDFITDGILRY